MSGEEKTYADPKRQRLADLIEESPNWTRNSLSLELGRDKSYLRKYLDGAWNSMGVKRELIVASLLGCDPREISQDPEWHEKNMDGPTFIELDPEILVAIISAIRNVLAEYGFQDLKPQQEAKAIAYTYKYAVRDPKEDVTAIARDMLRLVTDSR